MKLPSILLFTFFSLLGSLQAMDLSVTHHTFKGPSYNFVELNLFVLGPSVQFINKSATELQAGLEVLILIQQDSSIVQYDKYQLNSPITSRPVNFLDIKRYALGNGAYQLEILVTDMNDSTNTKTYETNFEVAYGDSTLALSDVQLLGAFHKDTLNSPMAKSGFYMESLPFNFYTKNADKLMFYVEAYNTDKNIDGEYLIRYFIEIRSGNGKKRPLLTGHKKQDPQAVNVMLMQRSIADLPSGNYNLRVEIRNRKNKVLCAKSMAFQRSNPTHIKKVEEPSPKKELAKNFTDDLSKQELRYSLKAIAPIIDDSAVEVLNMVIAGQDLAAQRRTLFAFWNSQNAADPQASYLQYMKVAEAVDKTYDSGFGYGFESDRGYMFMRYGKPDRVIREDNDPSAPPYEIWGYNKLDRTNQSDVKFIFYNPTLASGQFQLLHSTARGEINNAQWEVELYRGDTNTMNQTDFDSTTVPPGFNRRAREYFDDL